MKYIQLYRDGKDMIASDGVMKIDGRYNMQSIINEVKQRNKRFEANFPHKIATSFAICKGRMWDNPGKQIALQ